MALRDENVDYELMFFSEIDSPAIKSYCKIHNESEDKCVGSISNLKGIELPYCDLWFGGFPCTDISLAGKRKGFAFESQTRSSLGWEMIRLIREVEKKPKYIVFENVAAIFNEDNRPILNLFKNDLEDLGYCLYNDILNAKDFGVSQNRRRYFLVAILGEYNFNFNFKKINMESNPKKILLDGRQRDITHLIKKRYVKIVGKNDFEYYFENANIKGNKSKYKILELYNFEEMKQIFQLESELLPTITTRNFQNYNFKFELDNKIYLPSVKSAWIGMGFKEEDYNKVSSFSAKELFKQAGNSIPPQMIRAIIKKLFMLEELI
jgi:DNA (cytosine-5)-methyltransferase 1